MSHYFSCLIFVQMSKNSLRYWRTTDLETICKAPIKRKQPSNSWDKRTITLDTHAIAIKGTTIKEEISTFWLLHCECSPNKKDVLWKHSHLPGHHFKQKGNDGINHIVCAPTAECVSAMKHFVDGSDERLYRLYLSNNPERKGNW